MFGMYPDYPNDFGILLPQLYPQYPPGIEGGVGPSSLLIELLAYWRGENLNDSHTNGLTLTNVNGVTFDTGKLGNAFVFDQQSDQQMRLTSADDILNADFPTTFSVGMWFKTAHAEAPGSAYQQLAGGDKWGLYIKSGKIGWYDFGGTGDNFGTTTVSDDAWHHVVLRCASGVTNGTNVWLDGVLELTGTLTLSSNGTFFSLSHNKTDGQWYTGLMDEVPLASRKWTDAEVLAWYGNGTPPTYPFTGISPT